MSPGEVHIGRVRPRGEARLEVGCVEFGRAAERTRVEGSGAEFALAPAEAGLVEAGCVEFGRSAKERPFDAGSPRFALPPAEEVA